MRRPRPGMLDRMAKTQEGTMQYTCLHLSKKNAEDDSGQDIGTYTPALSYPMGFDQTTSKEVTTDTRVVTVDAQARLPLSAEGVVTSRDILQLTHFEGNELEFQPEYEVLGNPAPGPTALVVDLIRVSVLPDE